MEMPTTLFAAPEILSFKVVIIGYLLYLAGSKWRRHRKSTAFFRKDNTPQELQESTLYGSEQSVSCNIPIPLQGTYDQLYQKPDKRFIVADTKTRKNPYVYDSDVIQLSAYKLILENNREFKNKTIMPYGYMRLVCQGKTHYKKVDLMTEEDVTALYERREQLYNGSIEPDKADRPVKCVKCQHLTSCGGVKKYKQREKSKTTGFQDKSFSGWD